MSFIFSKEFVRFIEELDVMGVEKNPYVKLVELLETRHVRQVSALKDTELQLEGARESAMRWEESQKVLPLERAKK